MTGSTEGRESLPRGSPPSEPVVGAASQPPVRRWFRLGLAAQLTDDYSTEKSKPVPARARVPQWHLTALWITLLGGIPALAAGVGYYQAGYSLARALAAVAIGGCCYVAYAIPAAYLGARTGRGTALLTRPVFGTWASAVISDLLVAAGAARLAFVSTVVASLYSGVFGWRHAAVAAAALAVVAATINLFGLAGLAAVARYLSAPLLIAWACYFVTRGIVTGHVALGPRGGSPTLSFGAGVGIAIGVLAWGNEPDVWRYGKAKPGWSVAPYLAAFATGGLLLAAAGWLMASMSRTGTQAAFVDGVRSSTFGVLGLAAVIITVLQIAGSGGACYQMTNAVQNLIGQLRGWRRWHTAALVAALGGLTTWAIQGSVTGFARVAAWSAVVLPSVTVVMCIELLVLRRSAADRSGRRLKIPPWGRGGRKQNWVAIAAVLAAAVYGGWGMALFPGQQATHAVGPVPAESWLLAGGIYFAAGVALSACRWTRSVLSRARSTARQAAASRAEAKRQAVASRAEAKQQAAARRAAAKRQARTGRAAAKRQARARRAAARRAAAKRRPARPSRPIAVPPPRLRPRDYLEGIRRDLANVAPGNPYLDLVAVSAVPRDRLGDFAAEQAQLRASDRRSFLYLATRSDGVAGSLFAEFADGERRALDLLTIFTNALGRPAESGVSSPRAGCRAYPAFVAWLALNAEPVDAAVALVACRPAWSASISGLGRALREQPGYRFNDRACAFFELMAAPDSHAEDQLIGLLEGKMGAGQPPARASGYARLLASYQAMFWSTLAAEVAEVASPTGQ